jgi:hypothetical protein
LILALKKAGGVDFSLEKGWGWILSFFSLAHVQIPTNIPVQSIFHDPLFHQHMIYECAPDSLHENVDAKIYDYTCVFFHQFL